MTGAVRLDLHVHSLHSVDSRTPVERYAGRMAVAQVEGFALTDHNSIEGHRSLEALHVAYPRAILIPGVEVSTREGHLLGYGLDEMPPVGAPIAMTIDWIQRHGGVAVLAHPFRWAHGAGRRVAEAAAVPAIEAVNGHNGARANALANEVALRRGLGTCGGSDCHDPRRFASAVTEFPEAVRTVAEALDALRQGRCRAAGRSLSSGERVALGFATFARRVARGFHPI
ncbi:MAG: PHP domain-containing protein [Thermoplasmata archaeon]